MSETVMLLLAGAIPAFISGFVCARRFPRLLADPRPQVLVPMRRNEFRPSGVKAAEPDHRARWRHRMHHFIRLAERLAEARAVPPGRVPSLETLRLATGLSKRQAGYYLAVLKKGKVIETRPWAGSYWRLSRKGRRDALDLLPYPASRPPPPFRAGLSVDV